MSPSSYNNSPQQNGYQESPFLDYDNYEFSGDNSFDFSFADGSQPKMIGDLPGSNGSASEGSANAGSDNNDNDKRNHPDDEDEEEEGAAKRQETGEKAPKKPGRKPLTTEPTSVGLIPICNLICHRSVLTSRSFRSGKHRTGLLSAHSGSGRRST